MMQACTYIKPEHIRYLTITVFFAWVIAKKSILTFSDIAKSRSSKRRISSELPMLCAYLSRPGFVEINIGLHPLTRHRL